MTVFVHSIVTISLKFRFVDRLGPTATLSPPHEFWQTFVTIGSCNYFMGIILTYVVNSKKVKSREDDGLCFLTEKPLCVFGLKSIGTNWERFQLLFM